MFVPRQYLECLDSNAHLADVLLDTEDMQGALRAGGDVWELCSVDEWDASILGGQPISFDELQDSLDPRHFHVTIRALSSGLHEARAIHTASAITKHVLPLLAVARIRLRPDAAHLTVDDPWEMEPFAANGRARPTGKHFVNGAMPHSLLETDPTARAFTADAHRHQWSPSPPASGRASQQQAAAAAAAAAAELAARDLDSLALSGQISFVRSTKEQVRVEGMGGARLGPVVPPRRSVPRAAARKLLRVLWTLRAGVDRRCNVAEREQRNKDDLGATHLLLVQHRGTPMYGSELEDPDLVMQVFSALQNLHTALVHGDVNTGNIVWDPSGHFFQFVDLEFSTWTAEAPLPRPPPRREPSTPTNPPAATAPSDFWSPANGRNSRSPSTPSQRNTAHSTAQSFASPSASSRKARWSPGSVWGQASPQPSAGLGTRGGKDAAAVLGDVGRASGHSGGGGARTGGADVARIVSPGLVSWPLTSAAHGSTAAGRLAPHGTLELASFNQLKGCWPTPADDMAALFWSLLRTHCPRSLWWGGLQLEGLIRDAKTGAARQLQVNEEAHLLAFAQMVYLTTDAPSVRLIRRHGSFRAASTSPFVPSTADAMARWKHYIFRAFAGRHVLRLVASAGTRDEGAAITGFLSGLRGLLPRVCRRGGLGGAPQPLSDEDAVTIKRMEKAHRQGKEPMSYAEFLDFMSATANAPASSAQLAGPPSALLMSTALDAPPPPPLPRISFRRLDVLRTSAGGEVWTAAEARRARHARSPLAAPPWCIAQRRRSRCGAAPPQRPALAYGVAAAEEEARQERDEQLVSAALRMRVAAVAPTMLRDGDSVGNSWDEQLLKLQERRAQALLVRRQVSGALAVMLVVRPASLLAVAATLCALVHSAQQPLGSFPT
eukprot:jgi/Ulvmu1/8502/UM044_0036.1